MANKWGGGPANYYGTNPYFGGPLRDTGVQMKYSEPTERASNALATGASFLPFVGGIQDASSAYNSFSKGDLLGGAGYAALAGIGALPFGGMLKGVGKGLAKQIPMPGKRYDDYLDEGTFIKDKYLNKIIDSRDSSHLANKTYGPMDPKFNTTPPMSVPATVGQRRKLQDMIDEQNRVGSGYWGDGQDESYRAGFNEYVQFDPDNTPDWFL